MSDIAIRVNKLSKRYRIGIKDETQETLVGTVTNLVRQPFQNLRRLQSLTRFSEDEMHTDDVLWALKDVSFDVRQSEVVGVIGRNGAGKSTLLKILSRITHPTSGRVELRGRVSSLLEVGTGFHPELTGRENIYLNGTILGMRKTEIDRKFDEIVAFSGVEKFIDTPVKRYSSGMRVRLAFSVAAHLEPEILLVDEVLAVGDVEFQKKCLGKMGDMAQGGRTVLFVSHNMAAVQNLCERSLVLQSGKLITDNITRDAISSYLIQHTIIESKPSVSWYRESGYLSIIKDVNLYNDSGQITNRIQSGDEITIEIKYNSPVQLDYPIFGIGFDTIDGQRIFSLQTKLQYGNIDHLPQQGTTRCRVNSLPLSPGMYFMSFGCTSNNKQLDRLERAVQFQIVEADFFGTGNLPMANLGPILIDAEWTFFG